MPRRIQGVLEDITTPRRCNITAPSAEAPAKENKRWHMIS
jgi:hypothetical protein